MIDSAPALVRPAGAVRVMAWLHAGDRALMAALLSLHLAPLCLFAYFPTATALRTWRARCCCCAGSARTS